MPTSKRADSSKSNRGKGRGTTTQPRTVAQLSSRKKPKERSKYLGTGNSTVDKESSTLSLSASSMHTYQDIKRCATSPVPINPKLLKRFYEALVLLEVLGKNRGEKKEEEIPDIESDPVGLNKDRLRRSFIRNLAYLCDYEKGGDRTTAIALEKTPQCIRYHLASNKCPASMSASGDRTKQFAQEVLHMLRASTSSTLASIEVEIFHKAVIFQSPRIKEYSKILDNNIEVVLEHLQSLTDVEGTPKPA